MTSSMDVADAVVIGSGPNGLVAAITLARKGWDVTVLERNPTPGGAVASAELTKPGYIHDPFSAFYGLLHSTPVFRELGLDKRVEWAHFDTPVGAAIDQAGSTPMALILAMLAQQYGMPVPVGGAGRLTDGLVALLEEAGGHLHCSEAVSSVVIERGRARAVETSRGRIVRARHAILAD